MLAGEYCGPGAALNENGLGIQSPPDAIREGTFGNPDPLGAIHFSTPSASIDFVGTGAWDLRAVTMGRDKLRAAGARLVEEARALRAAFPNADAMRAVGICEIASQFVAGADELRTAIVYLREEMFLVQRGGTGTLVVLDDEVANVERVLNQL